MTEHLNVKTQSEILQTKYYFVFIIFQISYTKVADKMSYANSIDPDHTALKEQSSRGLYCLQFH